MKPSERIEELFEKHRERIERLKGRAPDAALEALTARLEVGVILEYIDEQHERDERRREAFRLLLTTLAGRLYNKQPGDIDIGSPNGPRPELPVRLQELVREVAAPNNWGIPEGRDYYEALLRYVEEGEREGLL